MSINGFDAEILQDFLTESGELLDSLESSLVDLESTPTDLDLLNEVFRALHTIKGSASFLALTNVVEIAHAAETALNAARNQEFVVDRHAMDLFLEAIDILKTQFDEIRAGETELTQASATLVAQLVALGEGANSEAPDVNAGETDGVPGVGDDGFTRSPLELSGGKSDLLDHFVQDLEDTIERAEKQLAGLINESDRERHFLALSESAEELLPTTEFFEFDEMTDLIRLLIEAAEAGSSLSDEIVNALQPKLSEVTKIVASQAQGIREGIRLSKPTETLAEEITSLLAGELPATQAQDEGEQRASKDELTALESVVHESTAPIAVSSTNSDSAKQTERKRPTATVPEQTIRVEVGRLETLMNLVGELVLQKNRMSAIAGDVASVETVAPDLSDSMTIAADTLARITSDIQVAVMRTRMQPLDKLFGKYPRLIRDLASKTGKQMALVIEGGDTEVDKSIIEELGDPLVHLMRNSADHGLEGPEERISAGKTATGTIRLCAAHRGNHVEIQIIDDGRGLPREVLAAKAVERGLVTETEAAQMSDEEVFRFIFHPGFSTASAVNDLSGRGVGMDVVRTNIQKLKGSVEVASEFGKGTTITILIPLTIAIMPAMMVGIADEIYAIPLGNIVEIMRPEPEQFSTMLQAPVLRLREEVLPALDAMEVFGVPEHARTESPFAIVLNAAGKSFALMVSSVIGQQEIVIKPLDAFEDVGPVSGATVRNDGGVSLIVDVAQLVRDTSLQIAAGCGEALVSA